MTKFKLSGYRSLALAVGATTALSFMALQYAGAQSEEQATEAGTITSAAAKKEALKEEAAAEAALAAKREKEKEKRDATAYEHYHLATHYMHHWDYKLAALELREAIVYDPEMKAAHRDYCVVAMMQGNPMQSVAEFMMTVGLGEAVPYEPDQIAALNKDASIAHYNVGVKFGKAKRWVPAIAEFHWAHLYAPDNGSIERSLAFAYSMNKQFELAEEHYKSSFEKDPQDGFSHADLAEMLVENGEKTGAIEQMSEAVRLEPKAAALHVDMAWIAESTGDLETAQKEFAEAVKLSPNHAALWAQLGKVFEKVGKPSQAADAYKHALALDSSLSDVQSSLGALRSGGGTDGDNQTKSAPTNGKKSSPS